MRWGIFNVSSEQEAVRALHKSKDKTAKKHNVDQTMTYLFNAEAVLRQVQNKRKRRTVDEFHPEYLLGTSISAHREQRGNTMHTKETNERTCKELRHQTD